MDVKAANAPAFDCSLLGGLGEYGEVDRYWYFEGHDMYYLACAQEAFNAWQATINSDYTFVVSESYKGDVGSEVSINMLCGIMEKSLFVKQVMKHDGYEQSEIDKVEEEPGKYIAFGLEGFNPLDLNEEYVIYAKYHPEHDYYYPVYYFYGVYEQNDNGEYERYGLDENDKQIKKIEELVECIK